MRSHTKYHILISSFIALSLTASISDPFITNKLLRQLPSVANVLITNEDGSFQTIYSNQQQSQTLIIVQSRFPPFPKTFRISVFGKLFRELRHSFALFAIVHDKAWTWPGALLKQLLSFLLERSILPISHDRGLQYCALRVCDMNLRVIYVSQYSADVVEFQLNEFKKNTQSTHLRLTIVVKTIVGLNFFGLCHWCERRPESRLLIPINSLLNLPELQVKHWRKDHPPHSFVDETVYSSEIVAQLKGVNPFRYYFDNAEMKSNVFSHFYASLLTKINATLLNIPKVGEVDSHHYIFEPKVFIISSEDENFIVMSKFGDVLQLGESSFSFLTCYKERDYSYRFYLSPFDDWIWRLLVISVGFLTLFINILFYIERIKTSFSPFFFILSCLLDDPYSVPSNVMGSLTFRLSAIFWLLVSCIFTNCYLGIVINHFSYPLPPIKDYFYWEDLASPVMENDALNNPSQCELPFWALLTGDFDGLPESYDHTAFLYLNVNAHKDNFKLISKYIPEMDPNPDDKYSNRSKGWRYEFWLKMRQEAGNEDLYSRVSKDKDKICLKHRMTGMHEIAVRIVTKLEKTIGSLFNTEQVFPSYKTQDDWSESSMMEKELVQCDKKFVLVGSQEYIQTESEYLRKSYQTKEFTRGQEDIFHTLQFHYFGKTLESSEKKYGLKEAFQRFLETGIYQETVKIKNMVDISRRRNATRYLSQDQGIDEGFKPQALSGSFLTIIYISSVCVSVCMVTYFGIEFHWPFVMSKVIALEIYVIAAVDKHRKYTKDKNTGSDALNKNESSIMFQDHKENMDCKSDIVYVRPRSVSPTTDNSSTILDIIKISESEEIIENNVDNEFEEDNVMPEEVDGNVKIEESKISEDFVCECEMSRTASAGSKISK